MSQEPIPTPTRLQDSERWPSRRPAWLSACLGWAGAVAVGTILGIYVLGTLTVLWVFAQLVFFLVFKIAGPELAGVLGIIGPITFGVLAFLAGWASAAGAWAELCVASYASRAGLTCALTVAATLIWYGLVRSMLVWFTEGPRAQLFTPTDVSLFSGVILGLAWGMDARCGLKLSSGASGDRA